MKRILLALDALAGLAPAPAVKPATPTPSSPPLSAPPAAPTPAPSDDPFEPPKKPAAAPAVPAKPAGAAPAVDFDKLAPKELRERVKQLNTEKEGWDKAKRELETKIQQFEGQGKDTTALTTRLADLEKERDSALADLRAARQEASPEFKEKYDKPFNQAAERAKKQITELAVVTDADTQQTRPATWEDFVALYQLPVGKAIEQANAMFGTSAQFVLGLREKLLDLDTTRQTALQEEKEQFKQRTAKEIAEQATRRETVSKSWNDANKRLSETVDDYKVDSTDSEAVEARKHALSVFDEPVKITDDASMQKKILKDAHVRQKVAAYAVQKLKISRLTSENETLRNQIAELKGTAPGAPQRPSGDVPAGEDEDWAAGAIKAAKSAA